MLRSANNITPKQKHRVKLMMMFALIGGTVQLFTNNVVDAKISDQLYTGPYVWEGETYASFQRIKSSQGYIDEYTNKEDFCHSWVFFPGLSLLSDTALGICYLLFLFWLFMGIAILADIFMEAIE